MQNSSVLGIDVGGTTTKFALVRAGDQPEILGKATVDTMPNNPADDLVRRIADAARPIIFNSPAQAVGIGVGCPGLIDHRAGIVRISANIPCINGFNLREALSKALNLPC